MSDNESMIKIKWAIVYIKEDDSYVLTLASNVMTLPKTTPEQKEDIRCYYNGMEYTGNVIEEGENHAELNKKMNKMNANRRRKEKDDSFDPSKKRRAALKCNSTFANIVNKGRKTTTNPVKETSSNSKSKRTRHSRNKSPKPSSSTSCNKESSSKQGTSKSSEPKKRLVDTLPVISKGSKKSESATDDQSDVSNDESGDDQPLKMSDFRRMQELAKKNKKLDFQSLMILAAKEKGSVSSEKTKNDDDLGEHDNGNNDGSTFSDEDETDDTKKENVRNDNTEKSEGDSSDSSDEPSSSQDEQPALKKKKEQDVDLSENDCDSDSESDTTKFQGRMYQWSKDDSQVVELNEGSGVYMKMIDKDRVRTQQSSGTGCARMLTRLIFTREAQLACSVAGKEARGTGKAERRPALGKEGVEAIVAYCLRRSKRKWREITEAQIHTAMGNQLCELRLAVQKQESKARELKEQLEKKRLEKEQRKKEKQERKEKEKQERKEKEKQERKEKERKEKRNNEDEKTD